MSKQHLPFGIRVGTNNELLISKEEYQELMAYAKERNVRLENFKRFGGNISLIKEMVDDVVAIAQDFPKLLEGKKSVIIRLEEHSSDNDFATTNHHIISINAKIFNNEDYLKKEYKILSDDRKFVKGTDYRSVIRHEIGHVVANIYGLCPMSIALQVMPEKKKSEIVRYVKLNISLYAADYDDGGEFMSECFSAYYSGIDISFTKEYIKKCKETIAKEGL